MTTKAADFIQPPFEVDSSNISQGDIAIMVLGPPGSGKTSLLGTMEGKGFILNTLPAERGAPIIYANQRDRITVKSIRDWTEIQAIFDFLKLGREKTGIQWFALDSFTGLGEIARRRVLKDRATRGISADPALMSKQDWGNLGGFLNEFLFQFLGLPIPKIFVSQERRYESDDLDSVVGPDTRPAVLGFFLQSMSGIGRIYSVPLGAGKFERRFLVAQHPNYCTKWQVESSRVEAFPSVIKNPNLAGILRYCYGPPGKYPAPEGADLVEEEAATGMQQL